MQIPCQAYLVDAETMEFPKSTGSGYALSRSGIMEEIVNGELLDLTDTGFGKFPIYNTVGLISKNTTPVGEINQRAHNRINENYRIGSASAALK